MLDALPRRLLSFGPVTVGVVVVPSVIREGTPATTLWLRFSALAEDECVKGTNADADDSGSCRLPTDLSTATLEGIGADAVGGCVVVCDNTALAFALHKPLLGWLL